MYLKNWDQMGEEQYRARTGTVLHRFIKEQVLKYSPFYKDLFKANGIGADDIRSIEDLRKIPFTCKADIAPTHEDPVKPRRLVLQPDKNTYASTIGLDKKLSLAWNKMKTGRSYEDQIFDEYLPIFFIATTGRSANPTPFLYTSRDYSYFREAGRRLFNIGEVRRKDDFVFNAFPYAPHLAFWIVYQGGIETGTPMFHTGGGKVFGTDKIVPAIRQFHSTVLIGIPGYIYHVVRTAAERGEDYSRVRMVALGAERVTKGFKRRLKDLLGTMGSKNPTILSTFGFTEARAAWIECPVDDSVNQSTGYHLYPDMEIFEIVDPKTGKNVGDGESGEIVYTALDWRGSVVLRYCTGDYAKGGITWKPCPACGRKGPRLSTDITRMCDASELKLSKIKGTLVDFNEFYSILGDIDGVVEWQIEITKRNNDPYDLDEVRVHIAAGPGNGKDQIASAIKKAVQERMELTVSEVHFMSTEEIAKSLGVEERPKELRVVDRRKELLSKE